ncbi:MAG TPA: zinc ribbon domain-containing protein [Opitutaceae bacterium]|nr:zinc ribbon domain-containing protein [Opitutaceae bacterium]
MPLRSVPETCPVCGAAVPADARACPECGADERTGWNEETTGYDGLDLPDEAFDSEPTRRAGRPQRRAGPNGMPLHWWLIGLVIVAALLLATLWPRGP